MRNKRNDNAENALPVMNIKTSSDAVASLQVGRYEDIGTDGNVLRRGYEVTLVASDDSQPQPQNIIVTLTADQSRNMAKALLAMANSVDVKNSKLQGVKYPF